MTSAPPGRITLNGDVEIRNAADIRDRVITALESSLEVEIAFEDLTGVDLTVIQIVESARVSAADQGKIVRLSAPASGLLREALDRGGFLCEPADERTRFWLAA